MSYNSRPTSMFGPASSSSSGLRQTSNLSGIPPQQSSALAARIAAKKAELDNLKQLRDMSATLATQMQALEAKVGTLKDGTEAVACVLANWDNVLRAISMASTKAAGLKEPEDHMGGQPNEPLMPATLVRIPAEEQKHTDDS
ncbi:DASH complex subunit Dad2-domain-containing protein [Aspergillus ambiguus]|uniref:DASH complex subunit DAD2 n=1 Tax=Aspergillus ambiguus TaxID=176160 RepID=UPI003CCD4597